MNRAVPISSLAEIAWPALPSGAGAAVLAMHRQLEESERWPAEILARMQRRQLGLLLEHARRTVPFYEKRIASLRRCDADGPTQEDWRQIPLLSRAELQDAGDEIVTRELPLDH